MNREIHQKHWLQKESNREVKKWRPDDQRDNEAEEGENHRDDETTEMKKDVFGKMSEDL